MRQSRTVVMGPDRARASERKPLLQATLAPLAPAWPRSGEGLDHRPREPASSVKGAGLRAPLVSTMAAPELGRRPAQAGDAAADAALAVVAADQLASRRIAATLGDAGLPRRVVSRTVDELLADPARRHARRRGAGHRPSRPEGLAAVRKLVKGLGDSQRGGGVRGGARSRACRSALSAGASAFVAEVQLESHARRGHRSALAGQVSFPASCTAARFVPPSPTARSRCWRSVVRGLGNRQIARAPLPLREHGQEPSGLRLPEAGRALAQGGRHRAARPGRGSRRKHSLRSPGPGRMKLTGDSAAGRR